MRNVNLTLENKLHIKCQCFVKKGFNPSSQKVSVFPEKGVIFSKKSAKRGGNFTPGEH